MFSDVNECLTTNDLYKHECDLKSTICTNLVGSYHCVCKEGYRENRADQTLCEGMEEVYRIDPQAVQH